MAHCSGCVVGGWIAAVFFLGKARPAYNLEVTLRAAGWVVDPDVMALPLHAAHLEVRTTARCLTTGWPQLALWKIVSLPCSVLNDRLDDRPCL